MSWVLDTSIVVQALRRDDRVLARLEEIDEKDVILTAPVLGELLLGARRSSRPEKNLTEVERLAARMTFEPFGRGAAERYATLRSELEKTGRNRSDFDLAIAAIALDLGATLVTHDGRFSTGGIAGLEIEDWIA